MHRWPDVNPQIAFSSKRKVPNCNKTNSFIKPNKFHFKYVCFGGWKTHEERKICSKICLFRFPQRRVQRPLARSFHPQLWLVHLKFEHVLKFNSHSSSRSNSNRFSGLFHTWQRRHWLLRKRERMQDRKLAGSRQRSLSCRFILPCRERPLLAGKQIPSAFSPPFHAIRCTWQHLLR